MEAFIMIKKIKGYFENRKAKKLLKEQTLQLQFMLLSKLYSVVKVFEGDLDIESIIALAEQLKGIDNKEIVRQIVDRVKDEVEDEFADEEEDEEDGE